MLTKWDNLRAKNIFLTKWDNLRTKNIFFTSEICCIYFYLQITGRRIARIVYIKILKPSRAVIYFIYMMFARNGIVRLVNIP